MSVRRKCFRAMLAGLFAAVGACAAFSQTPAAVPAGSADAQSGEQQPKKQRPEVFFPMTDQPADFCGDAGISTAWRIATGGFRADL